MIELIYDVSHNVAKRKALISWQQEEVCVWKGATRSFGPNEEKIPLDYLEIGQPVIIPETWVDILIFY